MNAHTLDLATAARPATAHTEWWRGAVLYQIYPRSFADANNDGVGDLKGITQHLDHVASLGVDGIWLSPFFTSPMKDFGYDVADYCDVDPIFGTLADFDALVARAHDLGLKVVIDQVFSHTSDEHPWFLDSRASRSGPHADWYVWADAKPDGSPPSNWQSVFGGPAWTWNARRGQYYMHNFLASQPQLNVRNPEVQDALIAAARFWLDRGVDGFRLDAINFSIHDLKLTDNPPINDGKKRTRPFDFQDKINNQSQPEIIGFLNRIRALTDSYEGRFTVAEVGGDHADREMKEYTAGTDRLHSAYGFLYLYADTLKSELVAQGETMWPDQQGEGWPSWTFSNHDAPRAVSRWAQGPHAHALACGPGQRRLLHRRALAAGRCAPSAAGGGCAGGRSGLDPAGGAPDDPAASSASGPPLRRHGADRDLAPVGVRTAGARRERGTASVRLQPGPRSGRMASARRRDADRGDQLD